MNDLNYMLYLTVAKWWKAQIPLFPQKNSAPEVVKIEEKTL